jgi:hypothetical protein
MPHSRRGEIPRSESVATRRSEAILGDEKGTSDLKPYFVGIVFPREVHGLAVSAVQLSRSRWAMLALAEQDRGSALRDRYRGLRHRLPELGIMAEKDTSAAPFQHL